MSERVGVVGLGLLGRGIATCFLNHGFQVVGVDRNPEPQAQHASFTQTADFAALADCKLVVESVTEDIATKDEVLAQIEAVVSADAIIASNTSAIPISALQIKRAHPGRFVGMHWAEPAHITRFLELIRGEQTSDATLAATEAMARRLGKDPHVCRKDVPGFIVNRIGYAMYREALHLLDTGVADAETIDRAMRNALGLWATVCGPFRWMDITGGPQLYAKAMAPVLPTLCNATEPSPTMQRERFHECSEEEQRKWEALYHLHAQRVTEMQQEYFGKP